MQYQELLKPENVQLKFEDQALIVLANIAHQLNQTTDNIGARRLQTVMSTLLEDILFDAPEEPGEKFITAIMVKDKLMKIMETEDDSKYIL